MSYASMGLLLILYQQPESGIFKIFMKTEYKTGVVKSIYI